MKAHMISEDGKRWIRIIPDDGFAWDEPITGWEQVIYLFEGRTAWRKNEIEITEGY